MRRDGKKLPQEEIRAGGRRGWLTFLRMPAGQPVWTARLSGQQGGNALPELTHATIKAINGGVLIQGFLADSGGVPVRQSWYCEPAQAPEGAERPGNLPIPGRRGARA